MGLGDFRGIALPTMLRAWAVVMLVLSGPFALLRQAKDSAHSSCITPHRRLDFGFLKSRTFWILQTGNILESLGFFMPNIWLPTYARAIGPLFSSGHCHGFLSSTLRLSSEQSSWAVLTDRFHVYFRHPHLDHRSYYVRVPALGPRGPPFHYSVFFSLCYGLTAGGFLFYMDWDDQGSEKRKTIEPSQAFSSAYGRLAEESESVCFPGL